jgi:antitoxin component YwqK of YwqJK toxin-antitoxin module
MKLPAEINQEILSEEYVLKHGVLIDDLYDEYYYDENGMYHYEQMFDKPRKQGGKPFTGIVCDIRDAGYVGYWEYKDGYEYGNSVGYYPSGAVAWFCRRTETEYYFYKWHENGVMSYCKQNHRKDDPGYYRIKEFDSDGKLIKQTLHCEFDIVYDFASPPAAVSVTWHQNGEFEKIIRKQPTSDTFYAEMQFDEDGYPVHFTINPNYNPAHLEPISYCETYHIQSSDKNYQNIGGFLMHRSGDQWYPYSGKLCFNQGKTIEKINEFKDGQLCGAQYTYYENGQLKEHYCISNGKEYYRHLSWFKNGTLKQVVLYSRDKVPVHRIQFDATWNIIKEQHTFYSDQHQ